MPSALALLVAIFASEPVETGRVMSVSEVLDRHDELDGRTIRVTGYVLRCTTIDCVLFDEMKRSDKFLGFNASKTFDRQIKKWIGRRVTVEARINADCLHYRLDKPEERTADIILCGDRVGDLVDPKILLTP